MNEGPIIAKEVSGAGLELLTELVTRTLAATAQVPATSTIIAGLRRR